MQPVIAIDLGGTAIKAAVVNGAEIVSAESIPAFSADGLAPQLPRVAELVRGVCARAGVVPEQCAGLGMAVPFLVDAPNRRITSAPKEKYADATAVDLVGWARECFGLELALENDAHAACLGEWRHGAGRGIDDLVMLTLGTGIGSSVIIRGRPLRGARFQAGVLCGHLIADPDGPACACCPAAGCFEALAASRSLPECARCSPDFAASALSRIGEIDFKAVFDHAAAGDRLAITIRDRVIRYWSALAVTVALAYDPDRIVIGGAVAGSAAVFLPPMRDFVIRHTWTTRPPDIVPAELGNHAGLVGVASLVAGLPEFISRILPNLPE